MSIPRCVLYHGTEMQMLFGNSEDVSGIPPIVAQDQLTEVMRRAWVAFANDPAHGLERFGWPRYAAGEETLVTLGHENSPAPDFGKPEVYSGNCSNKTLTGGK